MVKKYLGTNHERSMVYKAFKEGGWGFLFPASGTYTPHEEVVPRTDEQMRYTIPISVSHIDLGFKTIYLASDYIAFIPQWNEVRVVEMKTARSREKKDEVVAYYYLTEKVKKKTIGRGDNKRENPLFGLMRKSDFCMELETAWMLAGRMAENSVFNVPVKPYLHVKFVGFNSEMFYHIPELLSERTSSQVVLKVVKEVDNTISHYWQERKK